jgi:hypothetical protein
VGFVSVVASAFPGTLTIQAAGVPYTVSLSGTAPINATINTSTATATNSIRAVMFE